MSRLTRVRAIGMVLCLVLSTVLATSQETSEGPPGKQPVRSLKLPASLGPLQVIVFRVKVKEESKSKLEKLFLEEVLPYARRSTKIVKIRTYAKLVGGDFTYIVEVELKPNVPLTFGTVFEVLGNGRTAEEATKLINYLASFLQESSSSVVLYRPDLSISRSNAFVYRGSIPEKGVRQ